MRRMSELAVQCGATAEQWVDRHYRPYKIMSRTFVSWDCRSHSKCDESYQLHCHVR